MLQDRKITLISWYTHNFPLQTCYAYGESITQQLAYIVSKFHCHMRWVEPGDEWLSMQDSTLSVAKQATES